MLLSAKDILTIIHLIGLAIGAGGAFISDGLFFLDLRDRQVSTDELVTLKTMGKIVWLGLFILLISGAGLVATDPSFYFNSDKFLAKMTIIAVIIVNGLFFHLSHLPDLEKIQNTHISYLLTFTARRELLLISGAVSFTSWVSALILGSLRDLSMAYLHIIMLYILMCSTASLIALLLRQLLIPGKYD